MNGKYFSKSFKMVSLIPFCHSWAAIKGFFKTKPILLIPFLILFHPCFSLKWQSCSCLFQPSLLLVYEARSLYKYNTFMGTNYEAPSPEWDTVRGSTWIPLENSSSCYIATLTYFAGTSATKKKCLIWLIFDWGKSSKHFILCHWGRGQIRWSVCPWKSSLILLSIRGRTFQA